MSYDEYASDEALTGGTALAESEEYTSEMPFTAEAFEQAMEAGVLESPVLEAEPPYLTEEEEAAWEGQTATVTATSLRQRVVDAALAEVAVWESGARRETEAAMRPVLKGYWETLLSSQDAEKFIDHGYAWSAAFVCTVMKRAGAGTAFVKNSYHTGYTASAKDARQAGDATKWWAYEIAEAKPEVGDVVVRDRRPKSSSPCGGTTFANVQSHRTSPSHGDIVVEVKPGAISVVGGNVSAMGRSTGDTVAQRDITLDANGFVAPDAPGGCKFFAILKPPGAAVAGPSAPPGSSTVGALADMISSLPSRIAEFVRAGKVTLDVGLAIARGERSENTLANLVFAARHPELPAGYKIQANQKDLIRDWQDARDQVIRPLLQSLGSAAPTPAPTTTPSSPPTPATRTPAGVNSSVVRRIDGHRGVIDSAGPAHGVSANLLRGIIAAESGGNERTGAGGSGYKGLMQSDRTDEDLDPAVSVRKGAKKYVEFTQSMRRYFRDQLKQDFDALPEETRIRIVMAGYNAGPGTVKRAMQSARAAGDVTKWPEAEHYLRALIATGAYNPIESVLTWCLAHQELSADAMAADLARLSGKALADILRVYAPAGKWNVKALATALRPHLFHEKTAMKNDGSLSWADAQSRASKSLLCAARFKQAHTGGYLDTIVRYKRYYDGR